MITKTRIAFNVRTALENLQCKYQEWPEDMMGLCAIAAVELAIQFRNHGYEARAVWGTIEGEWGDHCWVECDGEIWDLTAEQFGNDDPIFRTTYNDPCWRYREYRDDDEVWGKKPKPGTDISKNYKVKLKSWPSYQRPQPRFTKVLRNSGV